MEYRFLVSDVGQLENYQQFVMRVKEKMEDFLSFLQNSYGISHIPSVVVLTDEITATQRISRIPLPAFTNDYRSVFCPETDVWKKLYLRQLSDDQEGKIRQYYETQLSENHTLQILGHEFVHHIDVFLDEEYDSGIWFEEGMCEYISRKFFLTPEEFEKETQINRLLVDGFEGTQGPKLLEDFGAETYRQDIAGIFYGYWKSYLAVQDLVERHSGNLMALFQSYHRWAAEKEKRTLAQWFGLE